MSSITPVFKAIGGVNIPSPNNGDVLTFNSANQLWESQANSGGSDVIANGGGVGDPYLDYATIAAATTTISLAINDTLFFPYFIPSTLSYLGFTLNFTVNTPADAFTVGWYQFNSSSGDYDLVDSATAATVGASQFGADFSSPVTFNRGSYICAIFRAGQGPVATTPLISTPGPHPLTAQNSFVNNSFLTVGALPASFTPSSVSNPLPSAPANTQIPYIPLRPN